MRSLIFAVVLLISIPALSQKGKLHSRKYPSLLWEITGKGMKKPSYLFGTMHVSNKMVFHLSDSFYLGIKNADIVALETDPETWQEDFSRYDIDGQELYALAAHLKGTPKEYITVNSLQFFPYDKLLEAALSSNPSIVNSFLYRSNSEASSDFEEDTYLDLHIFQTGKKWGKKLCGVENFDQSMQLMKEAYLDASKETNTKERSFDNDDEFSYSKLDEAYRTGNLDLLDTINKLNSTSAAFDEKFLYRRNEIQAHSIDSILKTKASLFAGVGAAHLPGQRGVIELLRKQGYKLRPIKMTERDSRHKEEIEKIRVPVQFSRQTANDGFFSVNMPGKLYNFSHSDGIIDQQQYADMVNGSYYMVTRVKTNAAIWGHDPKTVERKIDSVIYESIPGKIVSKKSINRNGYPGFDVLNRTRRGDFQRYNLFITPFEVIIFKMSGNDNYVNEGKEAEQFFNSIQLKEYKTEWKKYSPAFGGFEVNMPHEPEILKNSNWEFEAADALSQTAYDIIRTDIHNYDFVEEDSFDLNLMEESFSGSDFIDHQLNRKTRFIQGYPALETKYRYKDGSEALVEFIIQGPHYYTLIAHGKTENEKMRQFINSFTFIPFSYRASFQQNDTSLKYTVTSPVQINPKKKLTLYPDEFFTYRNKDDDFSPEVNMSSRYKWVVNDSTGEKICISVSRPSKYYFKKEVVKNTDTIHFRTENQNWTFRYRNRYQLPGKINVLEYKLSDPLSSRMVYGKVFTHNDVSYRLETEMDTSSKESEFISSFYNSFTPTDTLSGVDIKTKKAAIFFSDLFSRDSLSHRRAIRNVSKVVFDTSDLQQLKKAIQSLGWQEKRYLEVKKEFIGKLSGIPVKEASDYLKDLYYHADDTLDIQYAALEALLQQQTTYSYQVFKDIMTNEPPVLNTSYADAITPGNIEISSILYKFNQGNSADAEEYKDGSFMDDLTDSIRLTAGIFKDLLPLVNINDYEKPMMQLTGTLLDSNLITGADYELYQPKFLLEAKQLLKKELISEKNKEIERAQKDQTDKQLENNDNDKDYGNTQLSIYAKLLLPFYDKNQSVKQLFYQLLASRDNRLKFSTAELLWKGRKQVPDSMVRYFAGMDTYRYELYSFLKENKMLKMFPATWNNHIDLAKSKLYTLSGFEKPDSLVFIDQLLIDQKDRKGVVCFFKYKQKKGDVSWKLTSVGLLPSNPAQFEWDDAKDDSFDKNYNFTNSNEGKLNDEQPLKDQLAKAIRKIKYSMRKSAAEFYDSDDNASESYKVSFKE